MTNYYRQDGRYFGEDTSFYEFDEDCLKREIEDTRVESKISVDTPADSGRTDASDCEACSCDSEGHAEPPENFDRFFSNRKLDMLKTAIPFLPYRQQKAFACAVKLTEFRNLMGYFDRNQSELLSACSEPDPSMRMADMLEALRGYCSPAEQEQIDSLLQVLMTVQMMRE